MTIHRARASSLKSSLSPISRILLAGTAPGCFPGLSAACRPIYVFTDSETSEAVTEFLIAPCAKGADSGKAKKWVDRQRHERELQEACRLLYVAATRAREELHFFARPRFKSANGAPTELVEPRESLLRTGWPAWKGGDSTPL